jgi:hypothetical protein
MRTLLCLAVTLVLHGCQYNPYAHTFTTEKPNSGDVVGRYLLKDQTIVPGGVSAMRGRPCEVVLAGDGSFTATNVPPPFEFGTPAITSLDSLVSGSGTWRFEILGTVDDTKDHWGIRLGSLEKPLTYAGLTGDKRPYGLIFTVGDPDAGTVMILHRSEHK